MRCERGGSPKAILVKCRGTLFASDSFFKKRNDHSKVITQFVFLFVLFLRLKELLCHLRAVHSEDRSVLGKEGRIPLSFSELFLIKLCLCLLFIRRFRSRWWLSSCWHSFHPLVKRMPTRTKAFKRSKTTNEPQKHQARISDVKFDYTIFKIL